MKPFLTTLQGVQFKADGLDLLLGRMRSETVDCVFADPPFNFGKDCKNGFDDRLLEARYDQWCQAWIDQCARVLKPGGGFFPYATPELAIRFAAFLNERLTFRHWIALTMKGTSRPEESFPLFLRHKPRFDYRALFQADEDHSQQVLRRRQG